MFKKSPLPENPSPGAKVITETRCDRIAFVAQAAAHFLFNDFGLGLRRLVRRAVVAHPLKVKS
jgi:hypothetical protein